MEKLIQKIKRICFDPMKFFAKREKGYKNAFVYFAILVAFYTVLSSIMRLVTGEPFTDMLVSPQAMTAGTLALGIFVGYLLSLGLSFVGAGILHIWLKIFGGKAKYYQTYQLSVYSRTPSLLLGWIPFVGGLAGLYDLFLVIVGTHKLHKFSILKSVLVIVVPVVFLVALAIIAIVLFMGFAFTQNGFSM